MPAKSGMLTLVPPDEVQALFGEPPLLKDITDHSWEIRRLRRFKVFFVEIGHDEMLVVATLTAAGKPMPVPDSEKSLAHGLMYRINQYKTLDSLIASAELRRAHTLREIERHRKYLAQRLREASDEIVEGEFAELPQAAE